MSKKPETHDKDEKFEQPTDPTGSVHLKVLADLFTTDTSYIQGEVVEVTDDEAVHLMSEYAGYFEVVVDEQEG